jgi:hypothetical protein
VHQEIIQDYELKESLKFKIITTPPINENIKKIIDE